MSDKASEKQPVTQLAAKPSENHPVLTQTSSNKSPESPVIQNKPSENHPTTQMSVKPSESHPVVQMSVNKPSGSQQPAIQMSVNKPSGIKH